MRDRRLNYIMSAMFLLISAGVILSQKTIIPFGSVWKYLDDGSDQGKEWVDLEYNDSHWESGEAELRYGDRDEKTVVNFGVDPNKNYKNSEDPSFLSNRNQSG